MELGDDGLDAHRLLREGYICLALLIAVDWLSSKVSGWSEHFIFCLSGPNCSKIQLGQEVVDEMATLCCASKLDEVSHVLKQNATLRDVVTLSILRELLVEQFHLSYQLVIEQQLYSCGCEIEP